MELSMDKKLDMLLQMYRMRFFEETCRKGFLESKLQGFIHVGVGEEACAAGVIANLTEDDYLSSTHRGHGHVLLKGADPKLMFAELAGRATGLCKGRGGSMHMGDISKNILGTNGILGAGSPLMIGPALAAQIQNKKFISVVFFGDGQSNEGGHHEAMNMAAAFKLPVLFVCVNNMYGMWTKLSDISAVTDLSERAAGYGMPGVMVDGNDVLAVYEAAKEAVSRARNGDGPTFLELKTYRWYDHSIGMRDDFRTKEEVAAWKLKDPIKKFKDYLAGEGVEEKTLNELEASAKKEIDEAFEFALNQPFPDVKWAYEDVYTNLDLSPEVEFKA